VKGVRLSRSYGQRGCEEKNGGEKCLGGPLRLKQVARTGLQVTERGGPRVGKTPTGKGAERMKKAPKTFEGKPILWGPARKGETKTPRR